MLVRPNDILVKDPKTVTFEDKNLMSLGPKIWNVWSAKIENSDHNFKNRYIATFLVSL